MNYDYWVHVKEVADTGNCKASGYVCNPIITTECPMDRYCGDSNRTVIEDSETAKRLLEERDS